MAARLTDRDKQLRTITERQLQSTVQGLLTAYGWKWYHAPDNKPANGHVQGIVPGFPDLIAIRRAQIIVAELKTEIGETLPAQDDWLDAFNDAGVAAYVWRPRDVEVIKTLLR